MGAMHPTRQMIGLGAAALFVLGACTPQPSDDTSTTVPASTSGAPTTTEAPPVTDATTSTMPTSTLVTSTTAPVTTTSGTPDTPPAPVAGLTIGIGGGSGEVIAEWDRGNESDLHHYNVWYSLLPSAGKVLLASVNHDVASIAGPAYDAGGGRTAYVDFPRDQLEQTECYQISAVDTAGNEGDRSPESCLPASPPSIVSGFTVGIGGGSGEVFLTWNRNPEPDIDRYVLWYSELPGGSKMLLNNVAHDPGSLSSPAYNYGGGVTAYIDFPRDLANDKQCYQISAIDTIGNESPRTTELCLTGL